MPTAAISSFILDTGLNNFSQATHIYICTQHPTTYIEATSTYALGNKNFGAGLVCGVPVDASPNGRKVVTNPVTNGNVTASGLATVAAITDNVNSRLHVSASMASAQQVYSGNFFNGPAFEVRIPSQP